MKTWRIGLLIVALTLSAAWSALAQKSEVVPKYDLTTESTFRGTIVDISERNCPVSGGLGFHFILKVQDKPIEIHVTSSKFMKSYGLALNRGDHVEVVGSKVNFEGVETIFAREVIRGNETFAFRDKAGRPLW